MNRSKFGVCALALLSVLGVRAEKVNFPGANAVPDAQGRYDLATAANWDGGEIPSASEVSITGTPTVVVTASKDVTLGKIWNGVTINNYASTHRQLVFDMTGYATTPRIDAQGYMWATGGGRYHDTFFKGGYFDWGGKVFCNNGGNDGYLNYSNIGISDGAVITNANGMKLGYTGQIGQKVDISGASKVYIAGDFSFQVYGTAAPDFTAAAQNSLRIADGSHFEVNALAWERGGDASTFNENLPIGQYKDWLVVSNATLTMSGRSSFGCRGYTFTHITADATVTAKDALITGHNVARGNLLRIDNGGTLNASTVYGGWDNAVDKKGLNRNRIEVLENGTLKTSGVFYFCYSMTCGNVLVVSNGTFACQNFMWNYNNANYGQNSVILSGPQASFTINTPSTPLFGVSPSCSFIVENGATYQPASPAFGYTGTFLSNDVLRVRTGGKFIGNLNNTASSVTTTTPAQTISTDCGIVVEDEGEVESSVVRIGGVDGYLRIDDGKVTVNGSSGVAQGLQLGFQGVYGGLATNSVLTLAGSKPELKVNNTKNVTFTRGAKLVYELPADGYDDGVVPFIIDGGSIENWESGCALELKGAQAMFDRHQELDKRADYTLLRAATGRTFISQNAIAAAAASLPERMSLAVVDDGTYKRLVLSIKPKRGFLLLFR